MTIISNLFAWFIKNFFLSIALLSTISALYIGSDFIHSPLNKIQINVKGTLDSDQEQQVTYVLMQYYAIDALAIDLYKVQHELTQIAWIKEVLVKRQTRHQLSIAISKRSLIAFWQNDRQFIDAQGEIIARVNSKQYNLPLLVGTGADKQYILEKYLWLQENLLKIINIEIGQLIFKDKIWNIISNQGMLIKLDDVQHNEKISALARVYPTIILRDEVASINLNYDRGLSVVWLKK
jgi:cell division septal protein FtsQ